MTTPEHDLNFESEPDPLLDLAAAIADRTAREGLADHRFLSRFLPLPPLPASPLLDRAKVGVTVWMLERLENPDVPSTIQQAFERVIDDAIIGEVLTGMGQEPTPQAVAAIRAELTRVAADFDNRPDLTGRNWTELRRKVETSYILASMYDVQPADIFRDDEHYGELFRNIQTPADIIKGALEHLNFMKQRAATPESYRQYCYVYTRLVVHRLEKYWGEEGLAQLDDAVIARLLGKEPE